MPYRKLRHEQMRIAMIGLGRMGANIARRLMRGGHEIVAYDRNPPLVAMLAGEGATPAASLEEVAATLEGPRIFWVMLPAGPPTESKLEPLRGLDSPGAERKRHVEGTRG